ncbi:MAG TPA: hypothetical protein PLB91_07160 [Spirochaetales bacterium]|nr:hypothetical protein [Spirochaetales bacterium]HRY53369.1 hypothetical protein [Spirochaetia bacterium]HRZ65239.1 hypothetical protein [Spirochaetia bacterium]
MGDCCSIDPAIRECLRVMLDSLADGLREGSVPEEGYARTLKYLRFKIGEDLYESYGEPRKELPS